MPIKNSRNSPLQIAELLLGAGEGHLGLTLCPGKKNASRNWDRDLKEDMRAIRAWGASIVVTLIEDHEFHLLAVEHLEQEVRAHGMEWRHLPIRDVDVPDQGFEDAWVQIGAELHHRLGTGARILIHCRGGMGRTGAITDDTQMTLFTAEGLLRAHVRRKLKGICSVPSVICHAYLRWLLTQGITPSAKNLDTGKDGWLWNEKTLHSRRAPGNTCISSLKGMTRFTDERAKNDSKGAGAIMRVAPVVCIAGSGDEKAAEEVFRLGKEISWITHGHPSGYRRIGFVTWKRRRRSAKCRMIYATIPNGILRTWRRQAAYASATRDGRCLEVARPPQERLPDQE